MPSLTIDASLLAVPLPSDTFDDTYRYIERIDDWVVFLNDQLIDIYMSENASAALFEDDKFPLRSRLLEIFQTHSIQEFDPNTVARVIENILRRTPHFETKFKLKDVLFENITTNPDILSLSSGRALHLDLARCIILIAILRHHCYLPVLDHFLLINQAPDVNVDLSVLVHDLECDRSDICPLPEPPQVMKGSVLVCDDFHGLIENIDENIVFQNSIDDVRLESAIRIAIYKSRLLRGLDPEWENTEDFRIGDEFFSTVKHFCAVNNSSFSGKLLRAIVETIDMLNLQDTHILRTGPGGNDPPQMRGKDKAMRRRVDEFYRLHYWFCEDDHIELGSVVDHNDFSIPI